MSYVKYTKTATFLFPLLEIPKEVFRCNVINSFGKTVMTTRFLNSYLMSDDLQNSIYNSDPYIFLIIKPYQDINFDKFYEHLTTHSSYIDEYEKLNYIIMIFKIPDDYLEDYDKLISGEYSKISETTESLIIKNAFFSSDNYVLPLIFNKAKKLKLLWEKKLSFVAPGVNSPVDLGNQEVWGILDKQKETLTEKILKDLTTYPSSKSLNNYSKVE